MSEAIDKKSLSERDICTKYITPALTNRAWDINTQIREEVTLTKGRVIVRGKLASRGEQKRADYVLYHKPGVPLAVIEAKDNNHSVSAGMQQAIATGELIDVPFIFSSNGDAFMMCDRTITEGQREREIPLEQFPTPQELWQKYCDWKGIDSEIQPIVSQDYYPSPDKKQPRYYQQIAINSKPKPGQRDKYGKPIPDQVYNQRDFDRTLVLEKRTELVARIISDYLKSSDRFAKTIIFCETTDHAERMRVALVNENADLVAGNSRYIMRITGDDAQGKAELDNFIDPESKYPTIVTTSELLTTGVDAKTCKLIVLDQRILSMTKFKQIIGRGTRIDEDYGKMFFTIMDFKKATELFADPDFDGDPVQIYQPKPVDPIVPPDAGDDE
ncbi:type I restriction enzyme HsdR N-terminal domain-containing protein [Nostoc sp. CHAB 5834]|nr:type I restriction enzyme HsdR N-terminal domain-containing protein [Nostoc sp. CHAB 5834]